MKIKLLILSLLTLSFTQAQIVNIPAVNFKNTLLNNSPIIDTNQDGEIQVSEAIATTNIKVWHKSITSLQGIEAFTNLEILNCFDNQITSLDLSTNTQLTTLTCATNQITSLNISQNVNLTSLS